MIWITYSADNGNNLSSDVCIPSGISSNGVGIIAIGTAKLSLPAQRASRIKFGDESIGPPEVCCPEKGAERRAAELGVAR